MDKIGKLFIQKIHTYSEFIGEESESKTGKSLHNFPMIISSQIILSVALLTRLGENPSKSMWLLGVE